MMNTFRVAYPSSRTLAGQVFRPVVEPRTYLRVGHLFAMFPLGIAYFVSLVVLFALGGSLIWTIPGVLIILLAIFGSRLIGDVESLMVGYVSDIEIKRPPWKTEDTQGWRSRLWVRMIDPTTWTGIVYLFIQFPLGIGAFVTLIVSFAVSGALIASPLVIQLTGDPLEMDFAGWSAILDRPAEAVWLIPVGLVMFLLTVHLVTVLSVLHATWARFMLGSRARVIQTPSISPDQSPDEERATVKEPPYSPAPDTGGRVRAFSPVAPQTSVPQSEKPPPGQDFDYGSAATSGSLLTARSLTEDLTQREREVLLLLARGMTNAEIAETCVISQGTVKTHVKRILAKLQLHDRTQVVVFAYETGLVTPETGKQARSAVNA